MFKKILLKPSSNMFVQLFRYAIVVGIAFPIDFGLLYFFTEHLHMHYLASTILAFTISMLVNFIISILWVFKARADRPLWKEITAFFIIGFVGLGLTAAIVWLCTSVFGIYYLVSKLIAVSIVFFWSFGARRLMFMKHSKEYLSLFGKIFKKGSFVRSPAFIMFLISLVIFCLNLVLVYKLRPFNSDDVFWQAILLNWKPFDGTTVTLGNSSVYVDKIPFYQFINLFTEPGRKELFIQSAISAVLGFTGFYWASIYFVKRVVKKIRFTTLLPFVWIASFGYSLASLYLNPNWRGFQLGFSLALFALIAAYWSGSVSLRSVVSKCILVAVVLFAGLQLHSDPYFLYFTLAPLTVFSFIMYFYFRKIQRQAFIITLASIATTYLVSKAFAVITAAAGIKTAIAYPMQFISFEKLNESLESTAQSLLKIFNADFSEMEITSQVAIPLLNFLILLILSYGIYMFIKMVRQQKKIKKVSDETVWYLFFASVIVFIVLVYAFSTINLGAVTYRYLLFAALLSIPIFAVFIGNLRNTIWRTVLIALLIVASILNLSISPNNYKKSDPIQNIGNAENLHAIEVLKEQGYKKGYSGYWDANINTYLANDAVTFLPSVCPDSTLQFRKWLINNDAFNKKATKSFYLYNPSEYPCTDKELEAQFGEPETIIRSGSWLLFLYDYDISSKMQDYIIKDTEK